MQAYVWEGKNARGIVQKGEMLAANEAAVRTTLRGQKIQATKVKAKPKDLLENIAILKSRVSGKSLCVFTRQFATMIDAGLPLIQGLEILGSQEPNLTLKKAVSTIRGDVESGSTLSNALKKHPKIFSDLYVSLVSAGEMGGMLDTISNRLATYIEKSEKLKRKVKGAMVYPSVVLSIAIIVIAILLIFVILLVTIDAILFMIVKAFTIKSINHFTLLHYLSSFRYLAFLIIINPRNGILIKISDFV